MSPQTCSRRLAVCSDATLQTWVVLQFFFWIESAFPRWHFKQLFFFFLNCAVMNLSGVFVFLHCITWSWGDFAGLFTPGKICEYSFNYRIMDLLCVIGLITHHRFTDWPTVDSLRSLLMSFLLGRTQRSYGSSRRVLIFHVQVRHFGVVFVKWWHGVRIKRVCIIFWSCQ